MSEFGQFRSSAPTNSGAHPQHIMNPRGVPQQQYIRQVCEVRPHQNFPQNNGQMHTGGNEQPGYHTIYQNRPVARMPTNFAPRGTPQHIIRQEPPLGYRPLIGQQQIRAQPRPTVQMNMGMRPMQRTPPGVGAYPPQRFPSQPSTPQQRQPATPQQQVQYQSRMTPTMSPQMHQQSPTQPHAQSPINRNGSGPSSVQSNPFDGSQESQQFIPTSAAFMNGLPPNSTVRMRQPDGSIANVVMVTPDNMLRHPVTQRPMRFTTPSQQPVRYPYVSQSSATGSPPVGATSVQISRPNSAMEYRPQPVVVYSDGEQFQPPISGHSYPSTSQQSTYYTATPVPQTSALRQALGHESQFGAIRQENRMFKTPGSVSRQTSDEESFQPSVEAIITNVSAASAAFDTTQQLELTDGEPNFKRLKAAPPPRANKPIKKPIKRSDGRIVNEMDSDSSSTLNPHPKPLITESVLDEVARSVDASIVLEDDAKMGIMIYMEGLVDNLIKETTRGTRIRKSKNINMLDVEFALRRKFE